MSKNHNNFINDIVSFIINSYNKANMRFKYTYNNFKQYINNKTSIKALPKPDSSNEINESETEVVKVKIRKITIKKK